MLTAHHPSLPAEVQVDSTAASIPFEDEGRLVRSFEVLIYESYQRR